MSKNIRVDNPKLSILRMYAEGFSKEQSEGMVDCSKSTNEIIDELEPMATYSQDEVIHFMDDESFHAEWVRGELKWKMFKTIQKDGDD